MDATTCLAKTDCWAASAAVAAAVSLRIPRALGFAFFWLAADVDDPGIARVGDALWQLVLNGICRVFDAED